MAPSRKSKSANKRYSYASEDASRKKGDNTEKSGQRKRKLSNMLGPQWSEEELERFYESYRKYGKEWKKVAAVVRNRSVEMVEALYTMNRAYLSLPEGTASVIGLKAMMTDHYNILEGSDSEQESYEAASQKHVGGKLGNEPSKGSDGPYQDLLKFESAASSLASLRKKRSGSRTRAVAKRTPRFPVSYSCDKNMGKYLSSISPGLKPDIGTLNDDVAHEIALALTEASQRGGSPQVSQTPKRRRTPSPVQNGARMHNESERTSMRLHGSGMDDRGSDLSLGSTDADNGCHSRDKSSSMDTDYAGRVEFQQKGKRGHRKKPRLEESLNNNLDEIKEEACSGTEEEQKMNAGTRNIELEFTKEKKLSSSSRDARKRSKKVLFRKDEGSAFDALQTLADLSLMMPRTTVDTESFVQIQEEKPRTVDNFKLNENLGHGDDASVFQLSRLVKDLVDDVSVVAESEDGTSNAGSRTKRRKSLPFKLRMDATAELKKFTSKGKRSHIAEPSKQGNLVEPSEQTSTANDVNELNEPGPPAMHVLSPNRVNLPTKVRSRRKLETRKTPIDKDAEFSGDMIKSSEYIRDGPLPSSDYGSLKLKELLSNCLTCSQARKWCVFEWFYSAIDYPWFAKREFVEYLDHVGLSHVPRLTRIEWGVIRSSLGRPRRFSVQFLKEEREKLNQYRESVRTYYSELREGTREGLPTDLARPLFVGQKIIAVHPRTREIHDGVVLTVGHSTYRVQFNRCELGVESVRDVDCMPANPMESLPASLARQNIAFAKFIENLNEVKINGQPGELEGYMKIAPPENLEETSGPCHFSPSANYHINNLLKQQKGFLSSPDLQVEVGPGGTGKPEQATLQPSVIAQRHVKEADVQAIFELTRALDKKEAVLSELRRMNDDVLDKQKDGDKSIKDSEPFKKQYAALILQLNEINEQVSSALLCLRQRNTYQGQPPIAWPKPGASPGGHSSALEHVAYQLKESGSHVAEIVGTSRIKAHRMVDAAVQALSSLKKGGNGTESIEEAMDFVSNRLLVDDSCSLFTKSPIPTDVVHSSLISEDQLKTSIPNSLATNHTSDSELNLSDENATQFPSGLITHCVATLLTIQKCTERQFPPEDVAHALDLAVTNLQPSCSQNQPIYAEIQKCMGIIKNQILALVPT